MKGLATLVVMSVLTTHAAAIERHDTLQMSCSPDQTAVPARVPAEGGLCSVYRCATVAKTFKRL